MLQRRFLSLWFSHLMADWHTRRTPNLQDKPFVFAVNEKSRAVVSFASPAAVSLGVYPGMVLADAQILVPGLSVVEGNPDPEQLLRRIALRCIRYSPEVAIDGPDGLMINITGCAHLWGGEVSYYKEIVSRIQKGGYHIRAAIADTPGAAWAIARFCNNVTIAPVGAHRKILPQLQPIALRLSPEKLGLLRRFGFSTIQMLLNQPRVSLTPRFGKELLLRLDQAFGDVEEHLVPVIPPVPYGERLPCLEPIATAGGIEYALTRLLEMLCLRLQREGKGIRTLLFQCYRVDGAIIPLTVGTTRATYNINHLFKLFEPKISQLEPALGIELFTLDASKVEDAAPSQEALWGGPEEAGLAELLDRIANKIGIDTLSRFFPAQHHWPERSFTRVPLDHPTPTDSWPALPRPIQLVEPAERITVTAPVPDYPPMSFRHRNKLYKVVAATGPLRLENEWWIDEQRPRDYYAVEDEDGARYWIYRAGHYGRSQEVEWFLHGLFA